MKKAYLQWLIPILVLYLMVGITCLVFGEYFKNEIIETELSYMADHYRKGISETDIVIKTVVDYNDATAVYFNDINYTEEKDNIIRYLSYVAKDEAISMVVVCDSKGNGYNNRGENISFAGEKFFEEVVNVYSNGGKGILPVLKAGVFREDSIAVVNRVAFADGVKGYLISCVDSNKISNEIFKYETYYDRVALVSLNGRILAGAEVGTDFFENEKYRLNTDTIKLGISQKKDQILVIDGKRYMIMVPSKITSGSIIALVSFDKMDAHPTIKYKMGQFYKFVFILLLSTFVFILMNYITHYVSGRIKKRMESRENEKSKRDRLTGLYNENGVLEEIKRYIINPANSNGGVLYAIKTESLDPANSGKVTRELAERLPGNFRVSDIIGRGEDGIFIIFLKDITEPKDIRKQTDELQLFLYDFKTDLSSDDIKIRISAGRAIYPKDGSDAAQILSAARTAMEKSSNDGKGSISFYE